MSVVLSSKSISMSDGKSACYTCVEQLQREWEWRLLRFSTGSKETGQSEILGKYYSYLGTGLSKWHGALSVKYGYMHIYGHFTTQLYETSWVWTLLCINPSDLSLIPRPRRIHVMFFAYFPVGSVSKVWELHYINCGWSVKNIVS